MSYYNRTKKNSYWGDEDELGGDCYTRDDYGYNSYGYSGRKVGESTTRYSSYSWKPSIWTNYSFGTSVVEDDNSNLFVKDPVTYLTPTRSDIKLKKHIYNEKGFNTIKELARVCYFKMIDEKDYVSDQFADVDSLDESVMMDCIKKKELYDTIFDMYVPGNTPLEQAIAIYNKISDGAERRERSDEEGDDVDYDSTIDFDRAIYADPEMNEQLEFNELSKNRKMDILDKISIVSNLGEQFKVEKETSEKIVSNSETYSKKIMRDYAQFSQIELYQKMFPNFRTKFLTKDLTVNVPVDKKEQKQKIIILLDFSGSMDWDDKQLWVNAILIDRLRYVMKEEAEVFFSYFVCDSNRLEFQHLKNRQDVLNFWSTFSNRPNGGTTDINSMVERVAKEVAEGKLMNLDVDLSQEKPEILIINDGQDRVGAEKFPYKVNAISLMEFSEELKGLCVQTGGKQVQVESNGSVYSYCGEGKTNVHISK